MLSENDVLKQSRSAMDQWEKVWRSNAKINGEKYKKDGRKHQDLVFAGIGKSLVCIANGPSFEREIETLKQYNTDRQHDIACVDKCFKSLVDHGVKPDWVFLADAGISYKEHLEPWINDTEGVVLLANVNANTEWTLNWKGPVFFYVNKDNIQTEKIFCEISGCYEVIPASSNVGNTVLVFSAQIFGYDEYILLGYDFGWSADDNYYAFEDSPKRHWMAHAVMVDRGGKLFSTSQNLIFSARWLADFFTATQGRARFFSGANSGIISAPYVALEKLLKRASTRKLSQNERAEVLKARTKQILINAKTKDEGKKAACNLIDSLNISGVLIQHVPQETTEWMKSLS